LSYSCVPRDASSSGRSVSRATQSATGRRRSPVRSSRVEQGTPVGGSIDGLGRPRPRAAVVLAGHGRLVRPDLPAHRPRPRAGRRPGTLGDRARGRVSRVG
jgi:hypothetical protein